jgi:hypothetical protein
MRGDRLTVSRGPGWRKFLADVPDLHLWPIGTASVGNRIEGALIIDMRTGRYLLIDKNHVWFELDQAQVRLALTAGGEGQETP